MRQSLIDHLLHVRIPEDEPDLLLQNYEAASVVDALVEWLNTNRNELVAAIPDSMSYPYSGLSRLLEEA